MREIDDVIAKLKIISNTTNWDSPIENQLTIAVAIIYLEELKKLKG